MKEKQLLKQLAKKNPDAMAALIDQYGSYVLYIVTQIAGGLTPREDIQEATSDVFLALWKQLDHLSFESTDHLKAYLAAASRNKARNLLRDRKTVTCPLEDDLIITRPGLDEEILQNELTAIMQEALAGLSAEERYLFVKYYYQHTRIKNLELETGIPASTIKSKLARGRKKLKVILSERGYQYED